MSVIASLIILLHQISNQQVSREIESIRIRRRRPPRWSSPCGRYTIIAHSPDLSCTNLDDSLLKSKKEWARPRGAAAAAAAKRAAMLPRASANASTRINALVEIDRSVHRGKTYEYCFFIILSRMPPHVAVAKVQYCYLPNYSRSLTSRSRTHTNNNNNLYIVWMDGRRSQNNDPKEDTNGIL